MRHFSVKYRFEKGEIEVKYCPNQLMIADYFTKPMQGKFFRMFRDLIMGYVHINDIFKAIELSAKEHVDKSKTVTENSITNNGEKKLC